MQAFHNIDGAGDVFIVADHAGIAIPSGLDLGLPQEEMQRHIATDIGIGELTQQVAGALSARAVMSSFSRLVFDPNRAPEEAGLVPEISDGTPIPGNIGLDDAGRRHRLSLHDAYHQEIESRMATRTPTLLVSLHSFTRTLKTDPGTDRPWDAGLLYNEDAQTARIGIDFLRAEGLTVGDNEPYSGVLTGYTVIRHAEANGIPCLFVEIRNDHLQRPGGIEIWAERVARMIRHTQKALETEEGPDRDR